MLKASSEAKGAAMLYDLLAQAEPDTGDVIWTFVLGAILLVTAIVVLICLYRCSQQSSQSNSKVSAKMMELERELQKMKNKD